MNRQIRMIFETGIYGKIFHRYLYCLSRELKGCRSVLDLGCGSDSPIGLLSPPIPYSLGVEIFEPYWRGSKEKGIHTEYIRGDVRKLEFRSASFDAVLALDILEHLTKEEGYEVIRKIEKWAKRKVIVFTPNGYLKQKAYDKNPMQAHQSAWKTTELEVLSYRVWGMNGWKSLRGYLARLRFKPKILWRIVSDVTQVFLYHYPEYAFQLFCVKEIPEE